MEYQKNLPEYLKYLRKTNHYKQEEIAAYLHITRQTYSHYETGRINPPASVLYHLARFYGISVDEIMEHTQIGFWEEKSAEASVESSEAGTEEENSDVSERKLIACLHSLNEQNRKETLSIMWEIVQAKMNKQDSDTKKPFLHTEER